MRTLTTFMTLGILVFLGQQAVTLHKLTVCRQEAWRSSLTLHTRTLLTESLPSERDFLPSCKIIISRENNRVSWTRLPVPRRLIVPLYLRGKL